MDIFNTTVTCCAIIYQFLDSYSEYSSEARSLSTRFKWDARILQHFVDYFASRQQTVNDDSDIQLLDASVEYLVALLERANAITAKISTKRRWAREMSRATWFLHRNELRDLERELFEWTRRLDMRLVALPQRVRDVISVDDDSTTPGSGFAGSPEPSFVTQRRIEQFLRQGLDVQKRKWENLWIDNPFQRIKFSTSYPSSSGQFTIGRFAGRAVLIEHKQYPAHIQGDQVSFDKLKEEVGIFATALNALDPSVAGLLRCVGFFHEDDPPRFTLVHDMPDGNAETSTVSSLRQLIAAKDRSGKRLAPAHPLNQRLELARKLASAVLFLHAIGWVHKSISSQTILVIESSATEERKFPRPLGQPYLVDFSWARSIDGETDPMSRAGSRLWEEEIFHHPERQRQTSSILHGTSDDTFIRYSMIRYL